VSTQGDPVSGGLQVLGLLVDPDHVRRPVVQPGDEHRSASTKRVKRYTACGQKIPAPPGRNVVRGRRRGRPTSTCPGWLGRPGDVLGRHHVPTDGQLESVARLGTLQRQSLGEADLSSVVGQEDGDLLPGAFEAVDRELELQVAGSPKRRGTSSVISTDTTGRRKKGILGIDSGTMFWVKLVESGFLSQSLDIN
jgi:hypothetical protein